MLSVSHLNNCALLLEQWIVIVLCRDAHNFFSLNSLPSTTFGVEFLCCIVAAADASDCDDDDKSSKIAYTPHWIKWCVKTCTAQIVCVRQSCDKKQCYVPLLSLAWILTCGSVCVCVCVSFSQCYRQCDKIYRDFFCCSCFRLGKRVCVG